MRRPLVLAILMVAGASGCGDDDGPPPVRAVANDPPTLACRGFRGLDRETCEGSYFRCRQDTAEIIEDIDEGRDPDVRTISRRYAESYWGDWDAEARSAARTGCRRGLRR